jgi:hypothetical protein
MSMLATYATPSWPLQIALYDRLVGQIFVGGLQIPVFDMGALPDLDDDGNPPTCPYVVIGEPETSDVRPKNGTLWQVAKSIHVWSSYTGTEEALSINSEIIRLLRTSLPDLTPWGYTVRGERKMTEDVVTDLDLRLRHGIVRVEFFVQTT